MCNKYIHQPILLKEILEYVNFNNNDIVIDATIGEGGHSIEFIKHIPEGLLIGIDRDKDILEKAKQRIEAKYTNFKLINSEFIKLDEIIKDFDIDINKINFILYDLGISLFHYKNDQRGFSFNDEKSLDMRLNKNKGISACDIINNFNEDQLVKIFSEYGEERYSKRIAKAIVQRRKSKIFSNAKDLSQLIEDTTPKMIKKNKNKTIHPATKVFMALRIFVNNEFEQIEIGFKNIFEKLKKGTKIFVLTYHSLEDRLVKQIFKNLENPCECPPNFPICICNKKPILKIMNKKPIVSTSCEIQNNPRARSAKLRIAEIL